MLLPIGGMTLLGVGFGSRRKKVLGILLVFLMASGLLFLASCSSGSAALRVARRRRPGTPAGTYTVTVTGDFRIVDRANHNVHSNRKLSSKRLMPAARQASASDQVFDHRSTSPAPS